LLFPPSTGASAIRPASVPGTHRAGAGPATEVDAGEVGETVDAGEVGETVDAGETVEVGETVVAPGEMVDAPGETVDAPGETVLAFGETVDAPGDVTGDPPGEVLVGETPGDVSVGDPPVGDTLVVPLADPAPTPAPLVEVVPVAVAPGGVAGAVGGVRDRTAHGTSACMAREGAPSPYDLRRHIRNVNRVICTRST
jgi:hypothetical protein